MSTIVFAPKGRHEICCTVSGKQKIITVDVEASAVERLNASLEEKRGEKLTPCGYFDHQRGARSFVAKRFSWNNDKGIMLDVDWTNAGKTAVNGGDYASFSPCVSVAKESRQIVGIPANKGAEVGSLVNEPAFLSMPDVIAASRENVEVFDLACSRELAHELALDRDKKEEDNRKKGASAPDNKMKELIIQLLGLPPESDDDAIKAALVAETKKRSALKTESEELKKKVDDAEASRGRLEDENATLRAQLEEQSAISKKQHEDNKQAFLDLACSSGRIAPKDTASLERWGALYDADCANAQAALMDIPAPTAPVMGDGPNTLQKSDYDKLLDDCGK